jgi:DNA-binding transcriptional ArsR family regulator
MMPPGEESVSKSSSKTTEDVIYERRAQICKAFANTSRLKILDLISKREYTVTELQNELGLAQANISQHLAVLKGAGVIDTRRDGNQVYCFLSIPEVRQACQLISNVLRAQLRNGRKLVV